MSDAQGPSLAQMVELSGKPLLVYADGASRGNPGLGGAGWVFCLTEGEALAEGCAFLGHRTNNEAEYLAAALGLRAARDSGVTRVILRADSELLIRQVLGIYRVKNEKLKPLFAQLMAQLKTFAHWQAEHVPRARNALADRMANQAIDTRPGRLTA